jgi:integrase
MLATQFLSGVKISFGAIDANDLLITVIVNEGLVKKPGEALFMGKVGDTKTEASFRPLPLDTRLMAPLRELRSRSPRQLKPAAVRAGIGKIGWHTFRHTYSTMLRSIGTDIKLRILCGV